ncbi:hypothetical protein FLONG3_7906 [Fusarium longipes]|uniref:Uncharacterized protein n=1 Tax=Fusarium longipes TaxID=694270 RepID=A0A395SA94_9HYPO|nr:hypothetical protein FLONG3_7906 [Fusarium longipes]
MDKFTFVLQDGGQPVDRETKSQIRAHAMLGHLRQKFDASSTATDDSRTKGDLHPQKSLTNSEIDFQVLLFSAIEKQAPGSHWITEQNLLSLRRMTLEAINQQISMSNQVQDATICAIICLEMFESTLGSIDGPVHLRGLYDILARDQSSTSHYGLFTRAISCLDAIDSVLRDSCRLLTAEPLTPYLSSFVCADNVDTAPPPFWLNSPLRIIEGYGYIPNCIPNETLQLLTDSFWLFKVYHDEIYNGTVVLAQPEQELHTHFMIHERLMSSERREANTIQDRVMEMPYVYLWVLLTGAASVDSGMDDGSKQSRLESSRGFFYYRILQFMLTLGLRWWDDFEQPESFVLVMSSVTTTSLLLASYSGHLNAEVIGANPTATTFVLDCDWDKYPWKGETDCYVTQQTIVVGPWADKTPAPGAPTTGIYKESYVEEGDDDEEYFSFSAECQMSRTWAETCTTINIGGNDDFGPTATFPRSTGTVFDEFYPFFGYGAFNYLPVTVTAGQKYILAAKTAIADSTEASATSDAEAAKATIADDKASNTVDENLIIVTGEGSPTATATGGSSTASSTVDKDVITVTGEASPTTTTTSGSCTKRALSLWGLAGLVAAVALL